MVVKYENLSKHLDVSTYREVDIESFNKLLKLPYKYVDDINNTLLEVKTILHTAIDSCLSANKLKSETPGTLFLIGELFGLKTIEDYIVLIVDCLEYYKQFGKVIPFSKVFEDMYPNGFYSPKTVNDLYPIMRKLETRQKLKQGNTHEIVIR